MAGSTVASLSVEITGDISGLNRALTTGDRGIRGFSKRVGKDMTDLGTSLGLLSAPLVGFGIAGVAVASSFESSMNEISARTGLVGEDLEQIRAFALKMGAETSFSAQQASDAFLQLLSSGSSASEAIATLPHVMNLAAASGLELGYTADVLTDIMAQFGLNVSAVPENFVALQAELGVTDAMMTEFGNNGDATAQMEALAESLNITTDQLYEMWNASKPLNDDIVQLANNLGISAEDWEAYGESVGNITPEIRALIDETGLAGSRLAQMFNGVDPTWFNSRLTTAADVVDILTQAAGASSASVEDLAQGFSNVGPVANLFGLSVEETAAALAVLAENGIKGAEGGTALKSMLLNLARPTDEVQGALERLGVSLYDAEGNMRGFDAIVDDLDTALSALPMDQQIELSNTLAGSYGITAFSALRASDGIDAMQAAMDAAAGASEVADARLKGFAGASEALTGSIETLMINALTPFMEKTLTPLVQKITEIINIVSEWAAKNPEIANTIFIVTGAVAGLSAALTIGGIAFGAMGTAVSFLLSPIGLLVGAVAGLGALISATLPGIVASWGEAFRQIGIFIQTVIDKIDALISKMSGLQFSVGPVDLSGANNGVFPPSEWVPGGPAVGIPGHRTGLSFVPNDNYAAMLHRGERVLTANENRAYTSGRGGGGATVNIYGGVFPNGPQEFAEYVKDVLNGSAYG